jgi:hypothetical protein
MKRTVIAATFVALCSCSSNRPRDVHTAARPATPAPAPVVTHTPAPVAAHTPAPVAAHTPTLLAAIPRAWVATKPPPVVSLAPMPAAPQPNAGAAQPAPAALPPEPTPAEVPIEPDVIVSEATYRAPVDPVPVRAPRDPGDIADDHLASGVRMVLANDAVLADESKYTSVSVSNGVVTLRGSVRTDAERRRVELVARRVTGVQQVDSQLEIVPN